MFAEMPKWPELAAWLETFPRNDRRMMVIAHREELLDQAAEKINRANPHLRIGIEQADRYASSLSDVVIASIQTLQASKYKRLKRLIARVPFRLVIVDEAHHAAAATYRTTLAHLGFLPAADMTDRQEIEAADFDDVAVMEQALAGWDASAPQDRLLVGVTATPNRSDAIGLGCVFQSIAYSYALRDAIRDGWLVPILPWVIETKTSLDDVRTTAGEFNQKDLAATVNTEQRNELAVAAWCEHAAGESTIAFTVDVAHAHALAGEFAEQGIAAVALSGETPKDDRRNILRSYTDGRIQVIANCMVLTEGTDLPRTGCILHAKPTKSATLYEQMTGRGLRIHPGKTQCVVIDIVDIARRHSLQIAPVLYGLPPSVTGKGEQLDQIADEFEELLAKFPGLDKTARGRYTLDDLRAQAATFDIWSVPDMGEFGRGLSMSWIRLSDDLFRLSYPWEGGTETLTVEKNILGRFDLKVAGTGPNPGTGIGPARTIAAGVTTANACLLLAESFVAQERREIMRLKDTGAEWRKRPVSRGQLGMLRRLRVPCHPGMTMGEASSLIDLAKARGRR